MTLHCWGIRNSFGFVHKIRCNGILRSLNGKHMACCYFCWISFRWNGLTSSSTAGGDSPHETEFGFIQFAGHIPCLLFWDTQPSPFHLSAHLRNRRPQLLACWSFRSCQLPDGGSPRAHRTEEATSFIHVVKSPRPRVLSPSVTTFKSWWSPNHRFWQGTQNQKALSMGDKPP